MFITIKKSTIIASVLILAIMVTAIVVTAKKTNKVIPDLKIVVDAGHGGMDGGAVGVTGVLEKDLNLEVAKKLGSMLEAAGASVVFTRTEDISLHDKEKDKSTIRAQKRDDLAKRRDMAMAGDTDLFISIHMNKFEQSQYRGAQIFYADNDKSRTLADIIRKHVITVSEKSDIRATKPAYSTMYILKGTEKPAVIVECGFLSNPEEEKLLSDSKYQKKIAKAIFDGICEYLKVNKK